MRRDLSVAWANMRQYRGRLSSIGLVVVLGAAIALVCIGLVGRIAQRTVESVREGSALRTVELRSDPTRPDVRSLSATHLTQLEAVEGVDQVEPWLQASFGIKTKGVGGVLLYGTTPQAGALPPLVAGGPDVFPLAPGEAVLPARSQGEDLRVLLGTTVPVDYTRKTGEGAGTGASDRVKVVGLYDPSYAEDGPSAAYVERASVIRWAAARAGVPDKDFLMTVGWSRASVVTARSDQVPAVLAAVRGQGFDAQSLQQRLSALPAAFSVVRGLGFVALALLLLYSGLSGLALAGSFVRQRTREIGLLKALGCRRSRILRLFLVELLIAGTVATATGVVLGNLLSAGLSAGLGGHVVAGIRFPAGVALPGVGWSVLVFLAPALAIVIGGLAPARRAAAMAPDRALREW